MQQILRKLKRALSVVTLITRVWPQLRGPAYMVRHTLSYLIHSLS